MRGFCFGVVGLLSSGAFAQVVVPNAFSNSLGGTWYALYQPQFSPAPDYKMTIKPSQLTGLLNQDITSLQFRYTLGPPNFTGGQWPSSTFTLGCWIEMGDGNVMTDVKNGPLTINAGSYVASTSANPNNWTPEIKFDNPFHYTGGDLVIQYHLGSLPANVPQITFDAIVDSSTEYRSNVGAVIVTRLNTVPEPTSLAVLGLGALALVRRRRK